MGPLPSPTAGGAAQLPRQVLPPFRGPLRAANPAPLAAPPIQYGDFASWQRDWLQGAVREELTAFWKSQLAGELPVLRLPSDQPKPAVPTHHASSQRAMIPAPLREALKELARGEDATLYSLLLAAFYVLLSRYSEQDDIRLRPP